MQADCIDHGFVSTRKGYAKGRGAFRNSNLHRQIFFESNGFLPPVVRHSCDNARCINPAHLVGGTSSDNMWDRSRRGRAPKVQPTKRKLSYTEAQKIREAYKPGMTMEKLAEIYGLAKSNIFNLLRGKTYVS